MNDKIIFNVPIKKLLFGIYLVIGICILVIPSFAYPTRIISTIPSITETLFALGLSDEVIGVTTNCNYPKEAYKKAKIGQTVVNLEKVVSLKPDLIIMLEDAQQHDIWRLKTRGLPVATINPHNIQEVMDSIAYIGLLTGTKEKASSIIRDMNRRLIDVKERARNKPTPSIYLMIGYKPLVTAGGGTFISDIIDRAGGRNIVQNKSEYPQMNFEELYRLNPDYIIIPKGALTEAELQNDQKLSRLPAVYNGKILWMDPDILTRPGPRIIDAIEIISGYIYK